MKNISRKIIFYGLILILAFAAIGCGLDTQQQQEVTKEPEIRVITDMAGRDVSIPSEINKIVGTSPIACMYVYSLVPEKLAAWTKEIGNAESPYILPECRDLPLVGMNPINAEQTLKIMPDIIISAGSFDDTQISQADMLQSQINIPVVMVEGSLANTADAFRFLGEVTGDKERSEKLAAYAETTLIDAVEKAEQVIEEEKIRIYYAQGADGLETSSKGSRHTEVVDLVGGDNVVDIDESSDKWITASMEQVLAWDPDLIFGWKTDRGGYVEQILTDPKWKNVNAVKNGEVYGIPNKPYAWFATPPAANRLLGVKWLGNLLYPDVFTYNLYEEAKDFYKLFYHYELTEQEFYEITEGCLR